MAATKSVEYNLTLTELEWTELLRVLEQTLADIHGEMRRTEAPAYREEVRQEKNLLRSLTEKVRQLRR